MRRFGEFAASAVVAVAALIAVRFWVVDPYRCNVATKRATQIVRFISGLDATDSRVAIEARRSLNILQACDRCPENVAAAMDRAAAKRFLGQHRDAASIYTDALSFDRRPELYLNLGEAQLEYGDHQNGLRNLATACIYNPSLIDDVAEHHDEVRRFLDLYELKVTRKH